MRAGWSTPGADPDCFSGGVAVILREMAVTDPAAAAPAATAVDAAPTRHGRALAYVRRRWLLLGSLLVWFLFLLVFEPFDLSSGDEQTQFRFVQWIYGDAQHAVGYFFGLGFAEAPFYGIGKLLDHAGLHTVAGHPVEKSAIALGMGLLSLVAWPLLGNVIHGLRLRGDGVAILAAALGTPFFYYAVFYPGKSHALDALLFTGAIWLAFRYFASERPERWLTFALGGVLGFAATVRYFNGAAVVALVLLLLWWRRWRHALEVSVVFAALVVIPLRIVPAAGAPVFAGGIYSPRKVVTFAPLNPFRMLFTDHRGYFVWSPVAALALIGIVLLFRRRPEHRRFLTSVCAMSLALMSAYTLVPFWAGSWSFGQRFYTPLFPVVAIGLAGLIDAVPRTAVAAAAVATAWSLFLAFNLLTIGGPQYVSDTPGGASDVALIPHRTHTSVGAYLWGVRHRSVLLR